MKKHNILITVACAGLLASCAAAVPKELSSAREAYRRASTEETAQIAPAELHVASLALAKAEQSFKEIPESYMTRDLAYLAERKTQIAEATASIAIERENTSQANSDYRKEQSDALSETKQDLSQTRKDLTASRHSGEMTEEQLATEKKARLSAERRAADAMAALAKLAAVKEEPRGIVITLSGSVLFASGKADLLPEARTKLDQVAEVLLTTRDRHLIVEGHTDSQGSDRYNMDLSQRRADAVRDYLVQRDYQADRIQARGLGEGQPVADNGSAEGRANNRRVEIIIERESHVSNK
jgi:outer membrane protein OmpA-like peptidoglycan-associated protein